MILLSTPTNGTLHSASAESAECASLTVPVHRVRPQSSVLTDAHNQGWATALNMTPRPDIFAQQHSDVVAEPGWLDTLVEEMARVGAGLLSAAIAIKDTRGLTSTTVLDPATRMHRRLTMREIMRLPETFSAADIPWAPTGAILCTNTGLWACRFGDWAEKVRFTIRDYIAQNADGIWEAGFWPEDWQFAEDAHLQGVKVFCTRKVSVSHIGGFPFKNDRPWGTCDEDNWHPQDPPLTDRAWPVGAHLGGYDLDINPKTHAPEVWAALIEHYGVKSVVDVGAGSGHSSAWFCDHGIRTLAIEGEPQGAEECRKKGLAFEVVDFEEASPRPRNHDLAWCCEVVEHVSEGSIENLLRVFDGCRVVALTHALPGDVGYHHVNCRESDYWIEKLERRGFKHMRELSESLRAMTAARCVNRTLLVFERVGIAAAAE